MRSMARKRHTAEEIVAKLRQVDVLMAQGRQVADAVRAIGVTEVTYYTSGVAAFVVHGRGPLLLGNLAAKRDWGSAREYVDGMWRILQAPSAEAFVLATGRTETIRTFVNIAYATQGIELEWEGSGKEERALCRKTGKTLVAVDEAYYRPAEVQALIGDASKAAKKLGWVPRTGLEAIIEEMVASDIHRAKAIPISLKS
jgi:GDPmannose 4,6-dehydratase